MATTNLYVPNCGEKALLRAIIVSEVVYMGLYGVEIQPDGNTTINTITEITCDGNYAPKELKNELADKKTADKWYVYTNSDGKAEAQYGLDDQPQEWEFNNDDVDDNQTAYGIFLYGWRLKFKTGSGEIRVGDTVAGATSGATAVVTQVQLLSGSWGGGDAKGILIIKAPNGTFQDGENLQVSGANKAVADGGAYKELISVGAFSEPQAIDTNGQKIRVIPKRTMSTG